MKNKYKTTEKLNETYGTIFWGQSYNSFDEIPVPLKTITTHNPTLQLDWARFRSYSLNNYANYQVKLVRESKGEHQTVTTNLSGGFFKNSTIMTIIQRIWISYPMTTTLCGAV